MTLNHHKDFEF